MYQLAVVAKNAATGEVGVVRAQLDVPTTFVAETTVVWLSVFSSNLRHASLNFTLSWSGPNAVTPGEVKNAALLPQGGGPFFPAYPHTPRFS
jgi:hypothetical protein